MNTVCDLSIRFDLRVPPFAATNYALQHQACLDMVEWAEQHGFSRVMLGEHHGDPAGFTSAPLALAAAILGRTRSIKVEIAAVLVPLHDPVWLAEQIATIDCIAPGRLSVVIGAGYRKAEFEMAGIHRPDRGRLVEECVGVWHQAWAGKEFQWRGRTLLVTPTPGTPGGPHISVGGKSEAAARRAARLRCGFYPANTEPGLRDAYLNECRTVGYDGAVEGPCAGVPQPGFTMVATDPDETWGIIGRHALYDAATYASWQDDAVHSSFVVHDTSSLDKLRASGRYRVLTPPECVAWVQRTGGLLLHPLMGGISPAVAWQGLRLVECEVLPRLQTSVVS